MTKGKDSSIKPSPEKDFRVSIVLLYSVVIPLVVFVFLVFVFRIWFFGLALSLLGGGPRAQATNPAKQLAGIMTSFAAQHHWKNIYETNSPVSIDNGTPWFAYVYEGKGSLAVHTDLKHYLEAHGYTMKETWRNSDSSKGKAGNADQPWWDMDGSDAIKNIVHAEITDKTFYNGATISDIDSTGFEQNGIYHIPEGMIIVNISFTYGKSY
jgi:hypothetical protein